jgi:dephospho-CoA kinase
MKKVIAITGGIASGKSMATNYIREKGYIVIDADSVVHSMYGEKVFDEPLRSEFGEEIFSNGLVDRKKLGEIIYNDSSKREALNKITHPLIYERIKKEIDMCQSDIVFIDVALLFEAGFDSLADIIVCIKSSIDIRIKRLMNRDNISKEYALKKIESQMTNEEMCKKSDIIINHNNNDLTLFYNDIDKMLLEVKKYVKNISNI